MVDKYIEKAKEIIDFQLGEFHWFTSDVYIAASKSYQEVGDLKRASEYAKKATKISYNLLGAAHPKTAYCYLLQGKIYREMKQYAVSQPLIEQALNTMTVVFSDDSLQVADCLFELADVLIDSGQTKEAEEKAVKSLSIRSNNFGVDNPLIIESYQQLALIYDSLGNTDKAFLYYKNLIDYLKNIEDESIFEEIVKVIRNILCLYFRTLGADEKPIIHQIIRKKAKQDFMKEMFLELIEGDPISILSKHLTNYLKTGEAKDFDSLACIYHIATDDLSTFVWLEENKK